MSDDLDPGPPPAELKGFLTEHLMTGEPTRAELERVSRALLRPAVAPLSSSVPRRRLPPELLAVAAVVIVLVSGAVAFWKLRVHEPEAPFVDQAVFSALEQGDLERSEAALTDCSRPECVATRDELGRLARKVGEGAPIGIDDLGGLARFSADPLPTEHILSQLNTGVAATALRARQLEREGVSSAIATSAANTFGQALGEPSREGRRRLLAEVLRLVPNSSLGRQAKLLLDQDRPSSPSEAPPEPVAEGKRGPTMPPSELPAWQASMREQARQLTAEGKFDQAVELLESCLTVRPRHPDCVLQLAATFARRGRERQTEKDSAWAVALYREFLEIAPADHPQRARVEVLLGEVPERRPDEAREPAVTDVVDPFVADAAPREETIALVVGEKRRVTSPGIARIAIGHDDIADVRVEGAGALVLEGRTPGVTTLLLWTTNGKRSSFRVTVRAAP